MTLSPLLMAAGIATGATFDPDLSWRTIETDHFEIHFHQGEEQLADELSREIEGVYDTMLAELRWAPRARTQVTLIDRTDMANGYAMTVPYNNIVIYVTSPTADSSLDLYESWLPAIMTHEYTHILHMDTNHGVVRAARWVVGRIASTNNLSPLWMIEGLATYQETKHSQGGRGRSPTAHMIKRTAVLEDHFPPLGNLEGYQPNPPGGNLRYLFGQDLVGYVAETRGEAAWTKWIHTYGSSIPYLLPGRYVFGTGIQRLYDEWRADMHARYEAQAEAIRAEGVREGRLVSDGQANCSAPAFSPDGERLVWSCSDQRTGSAIWLADGQGEGGEVFLQDRGARSFTWRVDSQTFVYAGIHVVNRFNSWSDVFMVDLESKKIELLTAGARARDPDFSPDGSRLLVVTNKVSDNQLEVLTVDKRRTALTANTDHTQYSTPRYSPDGAVIAVSVRAHGRRNLWLYSPEGEPLRQLTSDLANEWDPRWSADGRWLYFTSSRSGVPNVFAVEVATERLWQVTNVLTGAAHPSPHPDGKTLAYQHYSHDGWDVRILDLDPATFIDRGTLARPLHHAAPLATLVTPVQHPVEASASARAWEGLETRVARGVPADPFGLAAQAPGESVDTNVQIEVEDVFGDERDYPFAIPPRRYNPLPTLLPRYYLPYVQVTPFEPRKPWDFIPWGVQVGASTGTSDALRRYGWSAGVHYRTDANYLGGFGSLTINRWLPVYNVGFSSAASPVGRLPSPWVDPAGQPIYTDERYWEKRRTGWASVSYPYTYRTTVFARYSLTQRSERFELPPLTNRHALPVRGYVGTLQGGWRYAWSKPTARQISMEDGRIFSLVGGLLHPWLGTWIRDAYGELRPFTQVQLTSEVREYVVNPWVPNHVLAVRAAGGLTLGSTDNFGAYQLGGSFGDGAFYATPSEFRMLRGYPVAHDIGDMYWLAGAEYRLPLWRIDRGLSVYPVYLRYLSARVFVDAGNAFTTVETFGDLLSGTLVGTGAELHVSGIYAWGIGITGRLGYAVGWSEGGFAPGSTEGLYFQLGGSF